MRNREALLAGAKRCLYEKGYTRTTARDIAAAAGVSLAAIGYHFRSKEALLNAALIEAIGEWGAELERALAAEADPAAAPLERFEATWTRVIDLFARYRPLWTANFELVTQIDHLPEEVRLALADAQQHGRLGLAALFHDLGPTADERAALVLGSFYQALLLGVMAQWLVAPDRAPSGRDLAEALRTIVADVGPGEGIAAGGAVGSTAPAGQPRVGCETGAPTPTHAPATRADIAP
jgi:AcrR family transcriptional regulator